MSQAKILFPSWDDWNVVNEGDTLSFQLSIEHDHPKFVLDGDNELHIVFDSTGKFSWVPSFDLANRLDKVKEININFKAIDKQGEAIDSKTIPFIVRHINRPPSIKELPTVYVKQSSENSYQISDRYVFDPDSDPLVFIPIPSEMPEGATLSSNGQFIWNPSRLQFFKLRNTPLEIHFKVQDQPGKLEQEGLLRIQQTQQDLPPEILVVPGESKVTLKEDETVSLKIYASDPNGDDNVKSIGLISNDKRVTSRFLIQHTPLQNEFIWSPGYDFVEEADSSHHFVITFFVLDQLNNRAEHQLEVTVVDAVNMVERDAVQFKKYRNSLIGAMMLIEDLDNNQKELNTDHKRAKRGKKHRSILNAGLGAATGLSPITFDTESAKVVSGIGGTTVLTLGTLEATEVIGKSQNSIMEKIRISIDLRNKIQSAGDAFAKKFALKSARRDEEFELEISKLRATMNDPRLVLLEMDAAVDRNPDRIKDADIKKVFLDFSE